MAVDYSGMVEDLKSELKQAIDKNKRSEEQANKTSELKRCAFCGGEARIEAESIGKEKYLYSVSCINDCVTQGIYHKTVDSAIKAWNTRTPVENVIERLETEGKLADEERDRCARENPLHFDTAKGYATGIYNAIEIIKEELM